MTHFANSPDHIIKTYSFSSHEMNYAAGVQKICERPEIISCKTLFCIQSFLVMSCFKPVVLWVIRSPVKTCIFTVFIPQYLPNLLMSYCYIFLFFHLIFSLLQTICHCKKNCIITILMNDDNTFGMEIVTFFFKSMSE